MDVSLASQHNLGSVSTEAAGGARRPEDSDVLVAETVLRRMRELSATDARAAHNVADTILDIPHTRGQPVRLTVPGDPPGTRYWAQIPSDRHAPVVIYRESLPGEEGRWLVTALMDQDAYVAYRDGLADNVVVQGVAAAVAAGTVPTIIVTPTEGRQAPEGPALP